MKLVVFSGLPGTGKSTIAEAVGKKLGIPAFAKDWLEGVLKSSKLVTDETEKFLGSAGYGLITVLAERQLMLGQSVILDSVASTESIRHTWKVLCKEYNAEWRVIECVCSDITIHRSRLSGRQRGIPGWHELEWSEVERVRSYYVPGRRTGWCLIWFALLIRMFPLLWNTAYKKRRVGKPSYGIAHPSSRSYYSFGWKGVGFKRLPFVRRTSGSKACLPLLDQVKASQSFRG